MDTLESLFGDHIYGIISDYLLGANLILIGRSPLDEEKQSRIKALEDLGSQVLYLQADVCHLIRMKEGLNQAKERFGTIHGVIHAAGIQSTQTIFDKDIQDFQQVLDPKITGTLVLDEVLQEETLDFTCYFSSSSAVLGDFGTCDYAIGNRFQMAYSRVKPSKSFCGGPGGSFFKKLVHDRRSRSILYERNTCN